MVAGDPEDGLEAGRCFSEDEVEVRDGLADVAADDEAVGLEQGMVEEVERGRVERMADVQVRDGVEFHFARLGTKTGSRISGSALNSAVKLGR